MEFERRKDTVIAHLGGELDHCSAERVRLELDRLIEDRAVKCLVLDMRGMTFMDSSGIGVILGRYRELRARGGTVVVRNMTPPVQRIFLLAGMNQVIDIL